MTCYFECNLLLIQEETGNNSLQINELLPGNYVMSRQQEFSERTGGINKDPFRLYHFLTYFFPYLDRLEQRFACQY
jgi:hypothetical protein